jgi:hypothetical protein
LLKGVFSGGVVICRVREKKVLIRNNLNIRRCRVESAEPGLRPNPVVVLQPIAEPKSTVTGLRA